jgi:predicted secreted protein
MQLRVIELSDGRFAIERHNPLLGWYEYRTTYTNCEEAVASAKDRYEEHMKLAKRQEEYNQKVARGEHIRFTIGE